MKSRKRLPRFSLILAVFFVLVGLLVYPIWSDLHAYFGGMIPVLQVLIVAGGAYIGYCYHLLKSAVLTGERRLLHLILLGVVDILMLGLLAALFWDLGLGSVLLIRTLTQNLTVIAWAGAVFAVLWFWPRWRPLAKRTRIGLLVGLALFTLIWISLPWQVDFTAQPVVFMQQDGLVATWGTNMDATHAITYGDTPTMEQYDQPQNHGLREISDGLGMAYLSGQPQGDKLYLQVFVEGIRQHKRSSTVKGGSAETSTIQVTFPPEDDDLFLAAFSDIHEVNIAYEWMARQIPWERVDYALFLGDFVNDVDQPNDLVENLLSLPTGGYNPPRVFARGNHETRGPGAWSLSGAFLPPGGNWYYTFLHGDVFFVVLDSGEDKPDDHVEYAGLIDFTSYHLEQAEWLAGVFESPEYQNARYRVVLVHIPPFETRYTSPALQPLWDVLKNQSDIDLVMSGHIHRGGIWMPDETGWPYPITTNGGPLGVDTAAVTAYLTADGIQLDLINILGQTTESAWVPAQQVSAKRVPAK